MPASWLFTYSLRKGGSVPSCCVTLYCIGVSDFFSSSSLGFLNVSILHPPRVFCVAAVFVDVVCDAGACASPRVHASALTSAVATTTEPLPLPQNEPLMLSPARECPASC